MEDTGKKMLKNVAKGLATAVAPPMLALFGKDASARTIKALVGVVTAAFSGAGVELYKQQGGEIYDSPSIRSGTIISPTIFNVATLFTSPFALHCFGERTGKTKVESGQETLMAFNKEGLSPISFESGRYVLTFDDNTGVGSYDFGSSSLTGVKERIAEQRSELERVAGEEGFLVARDERVKLNNLEREYAGLEKRYEEMRGVYETQVDMLNAELLKLTDFTLNAEESEVPTDLNGS